MKGKTKVMKNAISYNILQNPAYCTAFQYVPMTQRDNIEESSTSDMVSAAIYCAQKKEDFDQHLDFNAGGHHKPHNLHKVRQARVNATPMGDGDIDFDN